MEGEEIVEKKDGESHYHRKETEKGDDVFEGEKTECPIGIFKLALEFIDAALAGGKKVLVHCNQGESRGPSVALAYLASIGVLRTSDSKQAVQRFIALYPAYKPKAGVAKFLEKEWENLFE